MPINARSYSKIVDMVSDQILITIPNSRDAVKSHMLFGLTKLRALHIMQDPIAIQIAALQSLEMC